MDLAGKSSTCRGLLAALGPGWRVRKNSLCADNPVYELADRLRREDRSRGATLGHLYVAALLADLEDYRPPEGNMIQDSTIMLRTLAHHTVAATPGVVEVMETQLALHPRFTLSVVLTASRDARLRRLELRRRREGHEIAPDDLLVESDPGRFFAMEALLVRLATEHFGAITLDTTDLSPQAVVERVLAALAAHRAGCRGSRAQSEG
jgi:hypothetical protein